jgi:hypothetical protein
MNIVFELFGQAMFVGAGLIRCLLVIRSADWSPNLLASSLLLTLMHVI